MPLFFFSLAFGCDELNILLASCCPGSPEESSRIFTAGAGQRRDRKGDRIDSLGDGMDFPKHRDDDPSHRGSDVLRLFGDGAQAFMEFRYLCEPAREASFVLLPRRQEERALSCLSTAA